MAKDDRTRSLPAQGKTVGKTAQAERRQRLAEALRANLQKRKEQARSRQASTAGRDPAGKR